MKLSFNVEFFTKQILSVKYNVYKKKKQMILRESLLSNAEVIVKCIRRFLAALLQSLSIRL